MNAQQVGLASSDYCEFSTRVSGGKKIKSLASTVIDVRSRVNLALHSATVTYEDGSTLPVWFIMMAKYEDEDFYTEIGDTEEDIDGFFLDYYYGLFTDYWWNVGPRWTALIMNEADARLVFSRQRKDGESIGLSREFLARNIPPMEAQS